MKRALRLLAVSTAISAVTLAPRLARAEDPSCDAITKLGTGGTTTADAAPPVVYVTGSSAVKPLVAALAPAVFGATNPQKPATLVYVQSGSCAGVQSIVAGTKIADTATAIYWDPNSTTIESATKSAREQACKIPTGGVNADIGVSDVFAETCNLSITGLPVQDFQGPIQTMTFAVNQFSKESSISAEAAYLTFGLHTLAPWTDTNFIFRRNAGSGTQAMIAAAINVPAASWTGQDKGNSDGVYQSLRSLLDQTQQDKGIGILAADFSRKAQVKQLAYQHYGQRCGYLPDNNSSLDKKNVREGRYAIWGPLHLLTQTDGSGLAKKQEARDFIAYLLGTQPPPLNVDLIRLESQLHVVPPCAMKVKRTSEMGPMISNTGIKTCGCAYDKEGTGQTTCTACTTNQQCTGNQSCNFGYCE